MTSALRRFLFLLALMVSASALVATPAFALDLETAKAQGQVGERPDGLLGLVGTPAPDVQSLVKDVNTRRMDLFRKIASEKGQSLAAVQAVSGEEFISRTRPGHFIMNGSGAWVKK